MKAIFLSLASLCAGLAVLHAEKPVVIAPVSVSAGDFGLSMAINPDTQLVLSATVTTVVPHSFAELVGLQKGDALIKAGGIPVTRYHAWELAGMHAFLEKGTDLVFTGPRTGRFVDTETISVTCRSAAQ